MSDGARLACAGARRSQSGDGPVGALVASTTVRDVTTPPAPQPQSGPPSYAPPSSGDPAQPTGPYGAPGGQPAPSPGYGAPPSGYGAPPSGYGPPTPGYGSPGYPAGPMPGPGAQPYPGGPQRTPGTDGFAIAAFVLSLPAVIPLAVIFGVLALSRIKRTGQGGRGLAIAALAVSAVWALLLTLATVGALAGAPERDTSGAVTKPATAEVNDLKVGDCLVDTPQESDNVRDMGVTPCTTAHRAEVFATFDLKKGDYPGEDAAAQQAEAGCGDRVPELKGVQADDLDLFYVYPKKVSWALGDRSVTCFVASKTPLTTRIVP